MRPALGALLALLVLAAPAGAQQGLSAVARHLQENPVYVDSQAELAGQVDANALRKQIRDSGAAPIYVAVLPQSAANGATPEATLRALHDAVGRRATYALVVGHALPRGVGHRPGGPAGHDRRAGAHRGHRGRAGGLHRPRRRPAQRSQAARLHRGPARAPPRSCRSCCSSLAGGGVFLLLSRRRRRRAAAAELAEVKDNTRDDLVALGDDIRALDLDVEMPGLDPAVREDYARAVEAYDRANRAFETARTPARARARRVGARGGPLGDGVGQGAPRGPRAARAPRAVLLRPPPRPVGPRRGVVAARRRAPPGPGLRGRRPARRARRGPADPRGRARRRARALLGRRPGVRAVLRRVLRRRSAASCPAC